MSKFVIYEIWTRSYVVEAESEAQALEDGEPRGPSELSLCNWHAVPVDGETAREDLPGLRMAKR